MRCSGFRAVQHIPALVTRSHKAPPGLGLRGEMELGVYGSKGLMGIHLSEHVESKAKAASCHVEC